MKKRIYNQTGLFGPNYAYLIVLSPTAQVKSDIAHLKKEIDKITSIGEKNLHSIAHITLTDRLSDDIDLPETISNLINPRESFSIKVNGWNYFDHGHSVTIYLSIENPEPIINLMRSLNASSKIPHLSLAKRISHEDFQKILPYLQNFDHTFEWICEDITVLRKLMSEKQLGFKESFKIPLSG